MTGCFVRRRAGLKCLNKICEEKRRAAHAHDENMNDVYFDGWRFYQPGILAKALNLKTPLRRSIDAIVLLPLALKKHQVHVNCYSFNRFPFERSDKKNGKLSPFLPRRLERAEFLRSYIE